MFFQENLIKLRKKAGYSARSFAKELDIPYTTYLAYEKTEREPKYQLLIKIASILNVSIDNLLGGAYTQERIIQRLNTLLNIANKKHNTNIKITKTENDDIYFKNFASTIPIEYSVNKNTFVQAFSRIDEEFYNNTSDVILVYLSNKSKDTTINKLQEKLIQASSLADEKERADKIKTISTAINQINFLKIDHSIYKNYFKDE